MTEATTPTSPTPPPSTEPVCPKCKQQLRRASFRTGMTGQQPEPSLMCERCGTRQAG
jgi:hypothetical protein